MPPVEECGAVLVEESARQTERIFSRLVPTAESRKKSIFGQFIGEPPLTAATSPYVLLLMGFAGSKCG